MNLIHGDKVVVLDENIKFPICYKCNSECTPMDIDKEMCLQVICKFINLFGKKRGEEMCKVYLWPNINLPEGSMILFVCVKCTGAKEIKLNDT